MPRPLVVDGFCGLGGWTEGFLAEGYRCVGIDTERHAYGHGGYPGELILQDWLTVDGRQFKEATVIVCSPPCTEYSYMAMPWKRAKIIGASLRGEAEFPEGYTGSKTIEELNMLFNACFRVQEEASQAAGHQIPMIVENVKGAQPWVGRAAWRFGSYYLWGDVPALMPSAKAMKANPDGTNHGVGLGFAVADSKNRGASIKNNGGSWFNIGSPGQTETSRNPVHEGVKVAGLNWSGSDKPGYVARAFNDTAANRIGWRDSEMDRGTSHGQRRKAASAQIAKIPFPLAQWIAKCYKP